MHLHAAHPIVALILITLFFASVLTAFLSAADTTQLQQEITEALLAALRDTGYAQKEIYMAMRYSKGTWSKVLSGEKPLSIVRLHRAPFKFYVKVFERLLAIKARDFASELREDAGTERRAVMAKADLIPRSETSVA